MCESSNNDNAYGGYNMINNLKYIGEKPTSLKPVERIFTITDNKHNSFDWIQLNDGYYTVRQSSGWALFSPTCKRMAIFGYLEIS